jgi:hypothetical protein
MGPVLKSEDRDPSEHFPWQRDEKLRQLSGLGGQRYGRQSGRRLLRRRYEPIYGNKKRARFRSLFCFLGFELIGLIRGRNPIDEIRHFNQISRSKSVIGISRFMDALNAGSSND